MITVVSAGVATSVRDGGRPGLAHLGRSRGGAVDLDALALANRLVGNDERAGAFETSGGLVLRADAAAVVAQAGATTSGDLGWGVATALAAGTVVHVGSLREGARAYVAVRGGLRDDLTVGPDPAGEMSPERAVPRPLVTDVHVWPGPRLDGFAPGAWDALVTTTWTVATTSRVGARLAGPALARTRTGELLPEGLVEGAVQVPPDGQPIVMLADHPTTGGYPVIAVVDPRDLRHVAQAAPGTALRLRAPRGFV